MFVTMDDKCDKSCILGQKLISALYELSKETFSVSDDTILDKLYVHIENNFIIEDIPESLLPGIGDWLEIVVKGWNENEFFHGVKIFAIRCIGFVGSSVKGFNILKTKNILDHISNKLITSAEIQNDSSIMVPLINVFGTILKHKDGWQWVAETRVWKYAMVAFYGNRSIYINRAAIKLLSQLLSTSVKYDKNIGVEILSIVCELLISNHLLTVETYFNDSELEVCNDSTIKTFYNGEKVTTSTPLTRAAKFLYDILEDLLSNDSYIPGKLSLVYRSAGDNHGTVLTSDILNTCRSLQIYQTYAQLLLLIDLSNALRKENCKSNSNECPLDPVYTHIYWVIKSMTSHNHFLAVNNYCATCLSLRAKCSKKNGCSNMSCDSCLHFESTIVYCLRIFLHLHVYCFLCGERCLCTRNLTRSSTVIEKLSIGESLYTKISSECFNYIDQRQKLCFQYIQLGVFGINRSLKYVTSSRNVENIFQDVVFTLSTMVTNFENNKEVVIPTILHLIDLASNIIENYHIPYWKLNEDNNENLFVTILRMLGAHCNDARVIVKSLQILNKMLRFHIMPDLLRKLELIRHIDVRLQLSNLAMLVYKLTSANWEVRDTTLEVLQTVIEMADLTPWFFIDPFQTGLLNTVLKSATDDDSAYVRGSALNFFTRTVRAKLFEYMISPSCLHDVAIKVLLEDNMPVARRAACELLTSLFIIYVPKVLNDANKIYEAMFVTTLKDLDWEVKQATLRFWQCTIDKHFMDEIVPLYPCVLYFIKDRAAHTETSSRIITVLGTLGEIGCLKAIWLGLNDDCDLKVSQEALKIVTHLQELDKQWHFIDYILNTESLVEENKEEPPYKQLLPKEFFSRIRNQEWKKTLDCRRNWIENTCDDLTSLLDHILNAENRMDDWDHNAVDCY